MERESIEALTTRAQCVLALLTLAALWPERFPEGRITVDLLREHCPHLGDNPTNVQHALDSARPDLLGLFGTEAIQKRKRGRQTGYRFRHAPNVVVINWLFDEGPELLLSATWKQFVAASAERTPSLDVVLTGLVGVMADSIAATDVARALALLDEWIEVLSAPIDPTRHQALLELAAAPPGDLSTLLALMRGLGAVGPPAVAAGLQIDIPRCIFIAKCARAGIVMGSEGTSRTVAEDTLSVAIAACPEVPSFNDRMLLARLHLLRVRWLLDMRFDDIAPGEGLSSERADLIRECLTRARSLEAGLSPRDRGLVVLYGARLALHEQRDVGVSAVYASGLAIAGQFLQAYQLFALVDDRKHMLTALQSAIRAFTPLAEEMSDPLQQGPLMWSVAKAMEITGRVATILEEPYAASSAFTLVAAITFQALIDDSYAEAPWPRTEQYRMACQYAHMARDQGGGANPARDQLLRDLEAECRQVLGAIPDDEDGPDRR